VAAEAEGGQDVAVQVNRLSTKMTKTRQEPARQNYRSNVLYDSERYLRLSSPIFSFMMHLNRHNHKLVQPPPGGLYHLLRLFSTSVGDAIGASDAVSDTIGRTLETLDRRLLLVRINVELDKQEQVAGQDTASEQGSSLSPSAVPKGRRAPIVGGETRVGAKVDREEIDDELSDLHRGQVLLPPDLLSPSGCVVVVIHEYVNGEVETDDDPRDTGATVELGETQESSDSVVVYVKESERFLLQYKKNGIEELEVLEIVVDNII